VSPAYVQRMLGHSSIKLTVDLYGRWLPMANEAAVDRLNDPTPSEVVADAVANSPEPTPTEKRPLVSSRTIGGGAVSRRRAS
jgi:hypothetical protein